MHMANHACRNTCTNNFVIVSIVVFIDVSKTTDKTDLTNAPQRENYWKHTLKTLTPYSLYLRSCCCCYTFWLQLLVIRYMINKIKANAVIRVWEAAIRANIIISYIYCILPFLSLVLFKWVVIVIVTDAALKPIIAVAGNMIYF